MEGGSTAARLASGNELCTIYSRPGKTGLKVELRRFDLAKEEFTSAGSVIIKGKKGSTKTDLVAAAYVENKAIIMPFVYLLVRHCYDDKDPLCAIGFITTDDQGKATFICLREFRDAALQTGGRVWILHGPIVVAEGSPGSPFLFFGRLTHTCEGLPKFITSQDPTLGLVCEQYALFVGSTAFDGQPLERDDGKKGTTNLLQFLKKDMLDGLALDYFADGGRKLAQRFVVDDGEELDNSGLLEDGGEESTQQWVIVPLPNEEAAEGAGEPDVGSEASPLPSPILMMEAEEDPLLSSFDLMDEEGGGLGAPVNEQSVQPDDSGRDTRLSWIPNLFAKRDNIAVVVFADNDDESRDYTYENEMGEEVVLKPSIFLGTKSKELVTIRNGEAVACHKLPAVPLSIALARLNNDAFVLVIKFEGHTVHIRHQDGTLLHEVDEVEDVLVGDFLLAGRDQVLLFHPAKLQKNGKPSKKDHFTLTDLHTTYAFPKKTKTKEQTTEGAYSQSLQWVAYSLHCRLQEGKQFLCDGRERFKAKRLLFNHAMDVLLRLAREEGSCMRIESPYLATIHGEKHFADELVALFDDDEPDDRRSGTETEAADLRVDALVAAFSGGQWVVTATITNTHTTRTRWCQGLLVSEPRLGLASASSGGFEDRVRLLPQASTTLTTLVSGNITTDATVDVWVQVFTDEAETQSANYGCLGSLPLRVRDQLIARPATATPIPFVPSLLPALEEVLPVSASGSSSGIDVRPNALAGVELLSKLAQSLSDEVASLSALIDDILERNRSRRKMLKIQKITREEIDTQAQLKRRYVEQQTRSDELFAFFLKSPYFN
ncbi:uncharacterized protein ACA1_075340 [Acanthamoeba castellanii str. Neff]|uniref:Uncharacterized protein n=1 Tax=Acanthamoeba castellanii (strain ATCC 30010 / Neff) TaxID=1257118 RepID=L8HFL9_ACACF|nr:uncharacterized protein ACA1_075340 [Acanthamoeba castellanii str. Neff]ELR23955.1 hypothetical protein ACA1_075340 [Acanthamoeba castellanii str. Neff]